tara:strand:+ start:138 stop:1544 length:1407 start_codon:yes stop_codon:yes gene_type:complete
MSINQPDNNFDFGSLTLGIPNTIQGGAYFTKIKMNNKPLYIETPITHTKQGFMKSGKKMYCDLMLDNTNNEFINWLENLEIACQRLISNHSDEWFENELDTTDIEDAFTSPIKIYKSGKNYLVRSNIRFNPVTNTPSIKIFSENEGSVNFQEIKSDTQIVSILEIQGIKFTNRNFQIDIDMKQCIVMDGEDIFNDCVISSMILRKNKNTLDSNPKEGGDINTNKNGTNTEGLFKDIENTELPLEPVSSTNIDKLDKLSDAIIEQVIDTSTIIDHDSSLPKILGNVGEVEQLPIEESLGNPEELNYVNDTNVTNENDENDENYENDREKKQIPNTDDIHMENNSNTELTEFHLDDSLDNLDIFELKKPNQVYYDIYKTARKKAIKAKKEALVAIAQAKDIKKTYMLEDIIDDSEDSEDNGEIESFGSIDDSYDEDEEDEEEGQEYVYDKKMNEEDDNKNLDSLIEIEEI